MDEKIILMSTLLLCLFIAGCYSIHDNDKGDNLTAWGNGVCESGEDELNCPKDCMIDCIELIPLHNKVNENRIDVVLIGFNYSSLDKFLDLAHIVIEDENIGLFSFEPFKSNMHKFNVWYVNKVGVAEDMMMDKQGVLLGTDKSHLSDICTKRLGYFREETTPENPFFSDRMINIFLVNKGIGGSAWGTAELGNVEDARRKNSDITDIGLKGAYVHIPEEGQPIYYPDSKGGFTMIENDTEHWKGKFDEKLLGFVHEFAHAFTIQKSVILYRPEGYREIKDEYSLISEPYSEDLDPLGVDREHSNCFIGSLKDCQSVNNEVFGDLIGDGCGEEGIIDCCTNDIEKINRGARSCDSCHTCHEDQNYDLEVSCYEGCKYQSGSYRATFNSIMRNHVSEPRSFGVVNQRILENQIEFLT